MKSTRMILFVVAALAGAGMTACNDLPSEPRQSATDPAFSASGGFVGWGSEEAAGATSASTASDSTTQRGGHGFGSGN